MIRRFLFVAAFAFASAACSAAIEPTANEPSGDFAAFTMCMNAGGCTEVPSCPAGSTAETCHLEADAYGRLVALWSCPSGQLPSCTPPAGDQLTK